MPRQFGDLFSDVTSFSDNVKSLAPPPPARFLVGGRVGAESLLPSIGLGVRTRSLGC